MGTREGFEPLEDRCLLATTLTWVGDLANAFPFLNTFDSNFLGDTNWSGDAVPGDGDTLVFPNGADFVGTIVNDSPAGRTYHLDFGQGGYNITGANSIVITDTGSAIPGGFALRTFTPFTTSNTISTPLVVGGDASIFNLVLDDLTLSGPISGSNAFTVTKSGDGRLTLAPNVAPNTFAGTFQVLDGPASLSGVFTDGTIAGPLTVGDGSGAAESATLDYGTDVAQIANGVTLTVNADGLFDMGGLFSTGEGLDGVVVNGGEINTAFSNGLFINGTDLKMTDGHIFGNAGVFLRGTGGLTTFAGTSGAVIDTDLGLDGQDRTFDVADVGSVLEDLVINGRISNGGIIKIGQGRMRLNGNNGYSGETVINDGVLVAGNDNALGQGQPFGGGTTVNGPGVLWLPGGITNQERLTLNGANTLVSRGFVNTLRGDITLQTDLTLDIDSGDLLRLTGSTTGGHDITKLGGGTLQFFGGSLFTGTTILTAGIVQADGLIGPVTLNGGRLQGFGTTGAVTGTANDGTIAPGTSPGILTTGTLTLDNTTNVEIEINGPGAGGGYDQLRVNGQVILNNANLVLLLGTPPGISALDTPYTIIRNDGVDKIVGLFDRPDGTPLLDQSLITIDGNTFLANYQGGDGNDFTLTVVAPPVARDDTYAFFETEPGPFLQTFFSPFSVLNNDFDPNGFAGPPNFNPMIPVLNTTTAHGELILHGDGTFEYTPNPGFNGVDSFTYWAYDGTIGPDGNPVLPPPTDPPANPPYGIFYSNLATVSIFVNPVTYNPVANGDTYSVDSTNVGTPTSGTGTQADPFVYTFKVDPPSGVLDNDFSPENLFPPGGPAPNQGLESQLISGPVHGTLTLNTDGSFNYVPDTGFIGQDEFVYRALDTDTGFLSEDVTVFLFVNPLNYFAPQGQADAYSVNEDEVLFISPPGVLANDTDLDGDFLTAIIDTAPTHGVVVLDAFGSFVYTPDANYNGADSFTYRAFDGTHFSDPITVALTVRPVADDIVASPDSLVGTEDVVLTIPVSTILVNDSNPDDPNYLNTLLVVRNGPVHGTLSGGTLNSDGTRSYTSVESIIYTPDANYNGPDSFSYFLSNPVTGQTSGSVTVSLTLAAVNDPPVANPDFYVMNEDGTLTITAPGVLGNDTDADGDALTASLASAPLHGIVTLNPDGSFTYTPNANYFGTDTFTYFANDGMAFSGLAATVTIQVNPIVDRPTAADDSYSVLEDTTLSVASPGILVNDTNVDDPTFGTTYTDTAVVVVNGPLHGTLTTSNTGAITYTPNANYFGTDSFTYFVRNTVTGLTSNTATVSLNVVAVPDLPVANPDAFTTNEDVALVVGGPGVLSNDVNVDKDAMHAVVIDGPSHGSVELRSDGSFTYTPDANYNGTDTFTYVAVNGAGPSAPATVTMTIRPVNDVPVANDDAFVMQADDTLTVAPPGILGNDTDADGQPLTAVLVNGVQHGTLTLNSDGSFTYVPNAQFVGTDSFTYKAYDGTDYSKVAKVTIEVRQNVPTTINLAPESDTGSSDSDRITKDNTPTFFGTTEPNLEVRLYARPFGSSGTPMQVGSTTADSQGNWRITSNLLPDGRWEFFVTGFRANGQSTGQVIEFGTLTIDTVAPKVDAALLSPKTGQVYISFHDNMSGMAQANIANVQNYSFAKMYTHAPRAFAVNSATPLPTNAPTDPQTVVLDVFGGRNAGHGRYLFAALSGSASPGGQGGISDVAGNALDGDFVNGTFPSGNGQAGGDFQAQFNTNGRDLTIATPATEFVPYFLAPQGNAPTIPFSLARTRTGLQDGYGAPIGQGGQLRLSRLRTRAAAQAPNGPMMLARRGR